MASNFPASSSSQQPFANPQPAPVAASHATSPPTKQSLKAWWKGFRPPAKSHEAPGKYLSCKKPTQKFFVDKFPSKVPRNLRTVFTESQMDGSASITDSHPLEVVRSASPIWQTTEVKGAYSPTGGSSKRRSMIVYTTKIMDPELPRPLTAIPTERPPIAPPTSYYENEYELRARSQTFAADDPDSIAPFAAFTTYGSVGQLEPVSAADSSGRLRPATAGHSPDRHEPVSPANNSSEGSLLGARIFPDPKTRPLTRFLRAMFSHSNSSGKNTKRKIKAVEQPTGIFGVPLRQSIAYANVAISLVDSEGKSYTYGYVPIVVAKCGVYLKEKGLFSWHVCADPANKL